MTRLRGTGVPPGNTGEDNIVTNSNNMKDYVMVIRRADGEIDRTLMKPTLQSLHANEQTGIFLPPGFTVDIIPIRKITGFHIINGRYGDTP